MKKIEFIGRLREKTGKGGARKTRREGFIPAILYGPGYEPLPIKVERKSTEKIINQLHGHNVMGNLKISDGKEEKIKVILKDIQFDEITGGILHLDFYRVRMDKPVVMEVPINLVGESPGVEKGGILEHELREIEIEVLPANIPEKIDVDISNLDIGDSLLVKDIEVGEGIKILEDEEKVVVSILAPKVVEEEEKEEEVEAEPEVISEEKVEERRKEEPSEESSKE